MCCAWIQNIQMSWEVQELSDDLKTRLSQYVDMFNAEDDELYPQLITNDKAYDYLAEQAPLLDIPDKMIEKTYYYRLWTLRKHWKNTPDGCRSTRPGRPGR